MRDLLLLLIVGIMFVFGYFVMGRLDRFLNALHVDSREDETENLEPDEVENPCFRCYNSGCKDRLRYPASRSAGQEDKPWRQPDKIRSSFLGRIGMTAGHRGG